MSKELLKIPTEATLKRYGLTLADWEAYAQKQNYVCYVCNKLTSTGRLVIDHEHVKNWKHMAPEARKQFVRGLLCWTCNVQFVGRGINVQKAKNVVTYLEEYALRRPDPLLFQTAPRSPKKRSK